MARTRLSLVPLEMQIGPKCGDFPRTQRRISEREDWVADDAVRCELLSLSTCVWRIADSGKISNSPHTGSDQRARQGPVSTHGASVLSGLKHAVKPFRVEFGADTFALSP